MANPRVAAPAIHSNVNTNKQRSRKKEKSSCKTAIKLVTVEKSRMIGVGVGVGVGSAVGVGSGVGVGAEPNVYSQYSPDGYNALHPEREVAHTPPDNPGQFTPTCAKVYTPSTVTQSAKGPEHTDADV